MNTRRLTAAALGDVATHLAEGDFAVLKRVSELRFATGSQLTRLHFAEGDSPAANARAARRALLRLMQLDVLERLPRAIGGARAGSAGFVYRPGLAGQRLAMERGWIPAQRARRSRVPGTLFVRHALQVAELHTRLIEADRAGRIELLELSAEPACHRRLPSGIGTQPEARLKPDSFLRLGAGDFEDSYFIEVDRGTEGSRALIRQLKAYLAYQASGREQRQRGVFPLVLWLAPDARRAQVITDCVRALPRADRGLFRVGLFTDALQLIRDTGGSNELSPTPAWPSGA